MRDLSIRGAGNLLGAQQHGFIDSVGFDLYSQMLKEAIEERREDGPKEKPFQVEIDLEVDAYLPEEYISDGRQKIDIYKRFRAVASLADLEELQEEIVDRFGDYPAEVGYLLQIAKLKVFAVQEKVDMIKQEKDSVALYVSEDASRLVDGQKLFELSNKYGRAVGLGMDGKRLKITIQTKGVIADKWLKITSELLNGLGSVKKEEISAN
jgi:transcription-repair coupling factor (superfamily II helicase)